MKKVFGYFLLLLMYACAERHNLENFNFNDWDNDKSGCRGIRSEMVENLKSQREKLKGLNEKQLVKILGSPDGRELYRRSQKFLIYELEPGNECSGKNRREDNLKMLIRLDALGYSNEIIFQR
jgi:hypothetical protein